MGLIALSGHSASQWATMWNFSDIFRICAKTDFSLFYQIMNSSIRFLDILVTSRISEGKRKRPESIILSFFDFTECHLLHMFRLRPYFDHTLLKKPKKKKIVQSLYRIGYTFLQSQKHGQTHGMGLISLSGHSASQWATMWNFSDIFRICAKNDFSLFYQIMKSSIRFLDILGTSRISEGKRKRPESIILSFFDFTECHLLHMFRLRPYFDHTLLKKPKKKIVQSLYRIGYTFLQSQKHGQTHGMGLISLSGHSASQWATMWNFSDIFRICAKNDFSLFYQIMNSSIKFLDILVTSRISEGKRKRPESIILSFFDFTECHLLHMFHLRPCFDHTLLKKPKKFFVQSLYRIRIYFSTIEKHGQTHGMGLISLSGHSASQWATMWNFSDIFRICAKNDFSLFYQIMNSSIKFLDILVTSRISEGKRKRPESIILSFFDFTECHLLHMFHLRPYFDHTLLKKPKKNIY